MAIGQKILTLEMAKKMAIAVEKKARENNINNIVSIYDNHGNLKYFQRMENTGYGSIRISKLKAKTSASIPISSKALAERSAKIPGNPYAEIPDMLLLAGGLPIITKEGQHIGSIGVSGATSELDEQCAQAGLDAISEDLS